MHSTQRLLSHVVASPRSAQSESARHITHLLVVVVSQTPRPPQSSSDVQSRSGPPPGRPPPGRPPPGRPPPGRPPPGRPPPGRRPPPPPPLRRSRKTSGFVLKKPLLFLTALFHPTQPNILRLFFQTSAKLNQLITSTAPTTIAG